MRAPAVRNCAGSGRVRSRRRRNRKIEQSGEGSVVTMSAGEGTGSTGLGTGSTELRRSNAPAVRNCDGRGPVAFGKSREKPHLPFSQWEDPESRLRLRTRRLSDALLLRCSDAEVDQDRARYNGVDQTGTVPDHTGTVPVAHYPVDATPSARQIKNRPPHPAVAKQRGRDIPVA